MSTTIVGARWRSSGCLSYFLIARGGGAGCAANERSVLAMFAGVAPVVLFVALALALAAWLHPDLGAAPLALGVLKWNKKAVTLKNEVTYGTDAIPAAANGVLGYDVAIKPLRLNLDHRDFALPWFGNQGDLVAGKYVEFDFKVPLAGGGAAGTAPGYGAALKACGLSETINAGVSVVYAPVTPTVGSDVSTDIYFYIDGRLHKITGALGDATFCLPAGKKPYVAFHFVGLFNGPIDSAIIVPTLTSFQKEIAVNSANTTPATLFTYAAKFRQIEVTLGNKLDYRNLPNSEAVRFIDRESTARIVMEGELVATKDWWSAITAETLGVLTVTQGTVAGNKVAIAASNAQLLEPDIAEENGIEMTTLPANLKPSVAGNDELSVTVT